MNVKIEKGWGKLLKDEFEKPYFQNIADRVRSEYSNQRTKIYPPASQIFAAFDACPLDVLKVVIIGQDPYHGDRQANGLAFSVNKDIAIPPSLINIFKEISADTNAPTPTDGDLTRWARQGVLLLNSTLTVRAHSPKSHANIGWQTFTDAVVSLLNSQCNNLVFMLWGSDAIRKGNQLDRQRHLVLTAPHPSPLSAYRGFFGCNHFSQANNYLTQHGKKTILW